MRPNSSPFPVPPDQQQRNVALDPKLSVLVQAPAGSGKTDLLTRRFLRLLAEVDDPRRIVAITFTRAAAAEMRNRILEELESAEERSAAGPSHQSFADGSMEALASRALEHSKKLNWRLIELSSQLRISTIDSFCRDLAMQQPIFSGIGNSLEINERPAELYAIAAQATLEKLGDTRYPELSAAIRDLLLWRDNSWKELLDLLVRMLGQRDRWMQGFVLDRKQDWDALRERLERPMARAVRDALTALEEMLTEEDRSEAHQLAQFACSNGAGERYGGLAELADFPSGPHDSHEALEEARGAYACVAKLLLKDDGVIRRNIDARLGFPKEHLDEKLRMQDLLERLGDVPGLDKALGRIRSLPPARYSEEDWQIIRASFLLLRHAAAELKTVFAEAGAVDFVEVAQIAKQVLLGDDNLPSDAAQAVADDIHHLLIDEFQDTSRRQHEFVTALIEAWPDVAGRTVFVVGDPMQSIYFFRDAEAELFTRVKDYGFELTGDESYPLAPVALSANFRTEPQLVAELNETFEKIFEAADGSGIEFARAEAARPAATAPGKRLDLHVEFVQSPRGGGANDAEAVRRKQEIAAERQAAREAQTSGIVGLIRDYLERAEKARASGRKYRIAVLGRARTALAPVAAALREAGIPFRAVELENLRDRPEILDAVMLTRALFNPQDRVAWLGVLRAPWCGLSLAELHDVAGIDEGSRAAAPVPQLLRERLSMLSAESRLAAERVLSACSSMSELRLAMPTAATGTLIEQIWREAGGDACVDEAARANLALYWRLLDSLPNGEADLVGPALDAALADLCALPDPGSSTDAGVQLMTIHKSKGLEFEVVIVPDLHAQGGRGSVDLLSWLERGLPEPDEEGALTEFLIAPVQYKGADAGAAKRWVDKARRDRESQEMRRLLYVAATRAREELHLFAQATYKVDADGTEKLTEPSRCLLATAWPALGEEIQARFDARTRTAQRVDSSGNELVLTSIAAGGRDNLIVMPSPPRTTVIHRLPSDFSSAAPGFARRPPAEVVGLGEPQSYTRHEGGLISRALGNAVHKLLEELSRLRQSMEWEQCRTALEGLRARTIAAIRALGVAKADADTISREAYEIAFKATYEQHGQWILSPHRESATEAGWAGTLSGTLHQIRIDRMFHAGVNPLSEGDDALWIVDYKTARVESQDSASAIAALRKTFAPQLEMYASILRNLHGSETQIRAGLYYPRMTLFDWWDV
ncbi:UvrD-helicase domain-containing protein [Occallatibacter savannae]|uniref:UvrD-helicase domain-containing protein n=1 Tax=Occallatibacter savannae TaxID=1002691 RepID=UPI000D68E7B3|nr:UvrD-helicase domain-containing protein [Occallatibacter savannae]